MRGKKAIGFEVKAATVWKKEYSGVLNQRFREKLLQKCFGIYLGDTRLKDHEVHVLPLKEFMRDIALGKILNIA
ncbi:MAG: hypothetical protein BROFUL_01943 [Candidatus Brocadia fulgida]|uniref:Uncharacterized protein n=1 Tax=Candidatus Brocadia fulgida TaxID=380242 RepID=A0A0M2UY00_9BACT|nr:MAG: hypothetical protein BROFUL_01943 [Candidatus Brocadia fulgida]